MKKFVLKSGHSHSQTPKEKVNYKIDYESLLNQNQFEAVSETEGALLVIAGAGTGKTRTLVYRVSRLIESGVRPGEILLLTFTRKAAFEMLHRASNILDERCSRVEGGTFHFYCSKLLHIYHDAIGYPANFTIIDTADAKDTIQYLRSQFDIQSGKIRFPNKNTLYSIFSSSMNKQAAIEKIVDEEFPQFYQHLELIERIYNNYMEYKRTNHVMDFDDLLCETRNLLANNPDIRKKVAAGNRYVMVDEFQDTNSLQAELSELFSSYHKNIMAVGDDAQSIYSFRGADHKNILEFPERFESTKIIRLEKNYRSTQSILNLANQLIKQASEKFDKELFTDNENGELPGIVKASNNNDQSRFLTQMILNLREQGIDLNNIAVLFRNGRDSFDLEIALNNKNIPYVKFGGQKFTEAAHIKDVLAHLRVYVNPLDTIAWNRVLMLIEGIGPKTAADLFRWIRNSEKPYNIHTAGIANERYLSQLKALAALFKELQDTGDNVRGILEKVVDYYQKFCKKRYDDYPKRLKDLQIFIDISGTYPSVQKMLEELALDPIESTALQTEESRNDENPLVLSTIHTAKGLEWHTVFIIQCLDGIIPSGYSVDSKEQLDEELRLLYVAATRAKKQLFFTYPAISQSGYHDYFTNPSRFLEYIDEQYTETWLLVEEESQMQLPGQ